MKRIFILGVNGSPHKSSHTARLLKITLSEAKRLGAKTQMIHLADYKILPHDGRLNSKIYIEKTKDDMPELQKLVLDADGIVFATPTHWFNVSSLMKLFLDRLTSLEDYAFLMEGKAAGIITYGPHGGASASAMIVAMTALHWGMCLPPYAAVFDEGRKDKWVKDDCSLIAKNMIQYIKVWRRSKLNWGFPDEEYEISPIELLTKKISHKGRADIEKRRIR